jgi:hypothetical protein
MPGWPLAAVLNTASPSTKLEYMSVGAGAANTLYENMIRVGVNYRFGG